MAVVPITQGARIRREPMPASRVVAPDMSSVGRSIGEGLQELGQAGSRFAEGEQRLVELRAEEETRRGDVGLMQAVRPLDQQVRRARGVNVRGALASAQEDLRTISGEILSNASSPLARQMLQRAIDRRVGQTLDSWSSHADTEEFRALDTGHEARANASIETALDHAEEPEIAAENMANAVIEVSRRAELNGWGDAVRQEQLLATRSRFHIGRARQRFEAEDPEGARAILDASGDEIRADDEAQMRRLISGELEANQASRDLAYVAELPTAEGAAPSSPDVPPGEAEWRSPVRVDSTTVPGGRFGAPRSYGGHVGRDYAGMRQGTPVYPMAEGTVRSVTRSNGGGNTVEIEYAGGYRSRYLHLADGSIRVREGQRVAPNDAVAGVGETGSASRGVHLHAELTDRQGRRIDPQTIVGERSTGLPAPDGRRVDIAVLYSRIDQQPWSESRKRRAREEAQRYAGQNDRVRERGEQDAERVLTQRLVEMNQSGQRLTNLSQLPAAALSDASPAFVLQLQASADANSRREPEANSVVMAELVLRAAEDPNAFLRESPELYRNRITDAEVMALHRTQAEIRNRAGPQPGQILEMINFVLPDTGLVPHIATTLSGPRRRVAREAAETAERQARARLLSAVQQRLSTQFPQGTPVRQQDILSAVRAEVATVTVNGQQTRVFEARERGQRSYTIRIPQRVLSRVDQDLRDAGLPITENNRGNAYLRNKAEYDAISR